MKKIGIIGGISWHSTISYYQYICQQSNLHFNNRKTPEILIYNMDMDQMEKLQYSNNWQKSAELIAEYAKSLELAGAEFVLIASATTNVVSDYVQSQIKIPLLSIVDAVAKSINQRKHRKVGLLGTKITMQHDYFINGLKKHGLIPIIPNQEQRDSIHNIIYQELCLGKIIPSSKQKYLQIIQELEQQGAESIILGCTEIPLLINQDDCKIPLINIVESHAEEAFKMGIQN